MPIYEYRCPNGHLLEVFHGMNDPSPTVCEICGEAPLERVLHPVAVHYKGSGFYSTDYGRGGRKSGKGDGAGGESSSTSETQAPSTPSVPSGNGSGGSGDSGGSRPSTGSSSGEG